MSHKSKYYVKKKVPKVVKNNYKIDSFFSEPSPGAGEEWNLLKEMKYFSKLISSFNLCYK